MREYLLCLVAAAAVTYLVTPFARELAIKWGAIAEPRDRDVHSRPTPRLGGLGLFAGVLVAILIASQLPLMSQVFESSGTVPSEVVGLIAAMLVLVAVGVLDDRYGLDPLTKFAGQVLAGGIIAYGGISLSWLPIGGVLVLDPITSVAITVLIVVFTINAINFVDGLDGLAAGIVAIAAAAFFAYSYLLSVQHGFDRATLAALVSAALVGACLGFLPHNFYRARLFMGDTGSMLLGLLLATSTITLVGQVDPNAIDSATIVPALLPLVIPIFVLAVPVLDVGLAIIRRTAAGRSVFEADKEHLHHRIMDLGHSQKRAVLLIYGWSAVIAGTTVAIAFLPASVAIGGGLIALAGVVAALRTPGGRAIRDDPADREAS
ncbi:MAG: undecaprenyl/decaprenyl-phosphate alpha-N-acetylglucosaminyl 1-phosphate transferase [Actinobacteria bacterium]|nr:undecaprenyl/decaprenyl-phosphate alpha-N-acetylglucosaminyl 1-phosphate transferase [Actinomycetota bacterium]